MFMDGEASMLSLPKLILRLSANQNSSRLPGGGVKMDNLILKCKCKPKELRISQENLKEKEKNCLISRWLIS